MPHAIFAMFITMIMLLVNCTEGPADTTVIPTDFEDKETDRPTQTPAPEPTQEPSPETQATQAATPDAPLPTPTSRGTEPSIPPKDPETAAPFGCGDFETWDEANQFFQENGGPDADPYHLDTDGDTIPCNADTDQGADTQLYPAPRAVTPFEGRTTGDCLTQEAQEALLTGQPGALAATTPQAAINIAYCLSDTELAERVIVASAAAQADLSGETKSCLDNEARGQTVRRMLLERAGGGESTLLVPALEYTMAIHWATCLNRQEWQETGMTERDQAHARCLAAGEGGIEALVSFMLDEATPEEADKATENAAHCAAMHPAEPLPECGPPGSDGTRDCP